MLTLCALTTWPASWMNLRHTANVIRTPSQYETRDPTQLSPSRALPFSGPRYLVFSCRSLTSSCLRNSWTSFWS